MYDAIASVLPDLCGPYINSIAFVDWPVSELWLLYSLFSLFKRYHVSL